MIICVVCAWLLQGNCLLVGVGGSGKQSLVRLAAYAAGCGVFEITLTRGYDEAAFREDLKELYTMLGAENKKMVFLFTDSHVADEGFLELINNMLTTGVCGAPEGLVRPLLVAQLRWHTQPASVPTRMALAMFNLIVLHFVAAVAVAMPPCRHGPRPVQRL